MRPLTASVSRCPRGPQSGADVGRQVLAGEGGAGGDEVLRLLTITGPDSVAKTRLTPQAWHASAPIFASRSDYTQDYWKQPLCRDGPGVRTSEAALRRPQGTRPQLRT
jgi:hypothetical protein